MSNKLTPPIASPVNSQSWMIWHKDLGNHLANQTTIKAKEVSGSTVKLNYNINGAIMNIQYYGPTSSEDNEIIAGLPVKCKYRSVVTITYSDDSQGVLAIEANSTSFKLPINTKDISDKRIHIQGQVFID